MRTLACLVLWLSWVAGALASSTALPLSGLPVQLAGVPMARQFSTEDFGASPQHLALSTDAEGRLLVGNVDGLLRFDGETWRLFELPGRAPMRSIAIITISTGAKVQAVAFSSDSHQTSGASAASPDTGRSTRNCAMHSPQATLVARPVRRSEPRRLTSSPL